MFANPVFITPGELCAPVQVDFNFLFSQFPSFDGEEIDGTRVNYEGLLFPAAARYKYASFSSSRLASRYHGFQGTGK